MTLDSLHAKTASPRVACLVFDSDSQYFACRNLVPYFIKGGWHLKFVVVGDFDYPAMETAGVPILRVPSINEIWHLPEMISCDAIGPYLPGSKLRSIWTGVNDHFTKTGTRPLLFTGYNGLILKLFEDGLSWRIGYDLIALNSPEDEMKAVAFEDHSTLKRAGLMPIIGIDRTNKRDVPPVDDSTPSWRDLKQIVFAEQVLFPKSDNEKFYLYSHLARIAMENPDWQIIIKPRTLPGGTTFHHQEEHISRFILQRFILPENLTIRYEPLDEILRVSTALLSISSTAFFDAVGQGVPSYILSDFGISSNYGTHFFHGSGCSICLSEIGRLSHELFDRRPSEEWLRFKGFSSQFSPMEIVTGLDDLIEAGTFRTPLPPHDVEQRLMPAAADLPPASLTLIARLERLLLDKGGRRPKTLKRSIARLRKRSRDFVRVIMGGSPSKSRKRDAEEGDTRDDT
ncbi:MAG: DUF6716 putative glycosyltransferase [Luteolibacter sp.]